MKEIYLDHCATTPVDEAVARLAHQTMTGYFGNPSSLHKKGLEAQLELDKARQRAASALGCQPEELLFTSGGTEGNNLAILGGARALRRRGDKLVAMAFEHSSVLGPLRQLEKEGFRLHLVPPGSDGNVDADAFLAAVDGDTVLASCMLVNSEVGSVAPVGALAREVHRRSKLALFHCDGVQALGKVPFSADALGVDLLTVSGHKIHCPKGVGGLYLRKGKRILPLQHGGGQERGLRPGTENLPLAAAFGLAAQTAVRELEKNRARVAEVCEYFVNKAARIPGVCINSPTDATPYVCNISLPGYRSETLLHFLAERGIYVSSGSACSKGAKSHVLTSMGLPHGRVDSALRVSFGKTNTKEDVDAFFEALTLAMAGLARSKVTG